MKILNTLSGGYRRVMDILLSVQTEMITLGNAPFASLGFDLVLSGCAVVDNGNGTVNIAPGLMYVGGNTLRFDGANNIASNGAMAIVTGGAVASYPRPFADGSTKNLYSEQKAVVGVQDAGNPFQMKITTSLYNLQQYIKDQINASEVKGTIKQIYDLDGTFARNFNSTGLGITPAWYNWALDNGSNGTIGSAGKVLIATGIYADPATGLQTNYNHADVGGEVSHILGRDGLPAVGLDVNGLTVNTTYHTGGNGQHAAANDPAAALAKTENMGAGLGHNNMQPYIAVYRIVKIN